MAINPSSKTTPVRVVFNSSHLYRGFSLNNCWAKGQEDMMNDLCGMLLRFREDECGAQGDIRKMFYGVRIEKDEQFMQLWTWQF